MMQIGEAAERVGLTLRTMRHWDEVGLVVPSARSNGGFRLYTETDIERLALVKTLKPLDFSLEQMRELLATTDALAADCGTDEVVTEDLLGRVAMYQAAASSRIETLRAHIRSLETLSHELHRQAVDCARRRETVRIAHSARRGSDD
jgi:DNA-binding transcriptional MerR regulator